jgi:hypothetical protein
MSTWGFGNTIFVDPRTKARITEGRGWMPKYGADVAHPASVLVPRGRMGIRGGPFRSGLCRRGGVRWVRGGSTIPMTLLRARLFPHGTGQWLPCGIWTIGASGRGSLWALSPDPRAPMPCCARPRSRADQAGHRPASEWFVCTQGRNYLLAK